MKKLLSIILVVCMMMTLAPVSFAQTADYTVGPAQTAYTAKVGETISVPFNLVPAASSADVCMVYATIAIPDGLTATVDAGKVPVTANSVSVTDEEVIIMYDANGTTVQYTPSDATMLTVNFTATKAGTFNIAASGVELYDDAYDSLVGDIAETGATLTFKADAPAGDADFDKFKAKGVYYEATSDFENTGVGEGMHMNISGTPYIYSIGTAEGLAAFKADAQYATLGADIEEVIASKNAKYASYTDKDQAYNYVDYEGKHAMFSINGVATKFKTSTWKNYLGAPNMYWQIDADYFASTDTAATFVIQYFDNTGAFTVRYSKQGGKNNAFTVKKEGTNTWVTKAFQVEDAMLNKGLTATGLVDDKHTGRFECGSETYISKFAVLKTDDYNDIMGIVPEVPELPSLEENLPADASAFLKNSTLVAKLDFDCGDFTKGDNVITAVDGLTGYKKNDNEYFEIAEVSEGNLVGHLYRANGDKPTNRVNWKPAALIDAPYMVLTYKANTNSTYDRIDFGFDYKNIYNGGVNYSGDVVTADTNGLPMILKNSQFNREGKTSKPYNDPENTGCDNTVTFEANKYQSAWHTYTYLVDAIGKKAYLFVDGDYLGSLVIYRNRSHENYAADLNTKYLSGVNTVAFAQDWSGGVSDGSTTRNTYYDDIMIRRMSAEQYAALAAEIEAPEVAAELESGAKLPTATFLGTPITWTSNNENVTVTDGVVEVVAGAAETSYDVVLTATYGENSKTYNTKVTVVLKYTEYIFGATQDKYYGMTSGNVTHDSGYNNATYNGLKFRNKLTKLDEPSTVYIVVDGKTATFVDADAYNSYEGTKGAFNNVNYIVPDGNNGDSNYNRYAQVGPEGDKRAAVFATGFVRADYRLGSNASIATKIHFNASSTFTANDNKLTVEVDMLDNRGVNDKLVLQYVNTAGKVVNAVSNERPSGNSGEWITVTFTLTDADFSKEASTGLCDNKQDFRVDSAGLPTYVSAVRVYNVAKKEIADADYTTVALPDYDVTTDINGDVVAKTAITAEEAADARLYVAYYNAKGDLVGVATSAQVTDGAAQTVTTAAAVGGNFNPGKHTIKTFVWDADLKPLR